MSKKPTMQNDMVVRKNKKPFFIAGGMLAVVLVLVVGGGFMLMRDSSVVKPAMTINGEPVSMQRYNRLKDLAIEDGAKESSVKHEIASVLVREHVMKKNKISIPELDITNHLMQERANDQGVEGFAPDYTETDQGEVVSGNQPPTVDDLNEWQRLEVEADLLEGHAAMHVIGGKWVSILDIPYESALRVGGDVAADARKRAEKKAKEIHSQVSKDPAQAVEEATKLARHEEFRYGGTSNRSQTVFTDGREAVYRTSSGGEPVEYLMPDMIKAISDQGEIGVGDIRVRSYDSNGENIPYGYLFVVVHKVVDADSEYPAKLQDEIDGARVVLYV